MDEKKWKEKIKKSAEDLEVPESLEPENMEKLLQNVKQKPKEKAGRIFTYSRRLGAAAAAVLVLGLSYQTVQLVREASEKSAAGTKVLATENPGSEKLENEDLGSDNLASDDQAGRSSKSDNLTEESAFDQSGADGGQIEDTLVSEEAGTLTSGAAEEAGTLASGAADEAGILASRTADEAGTLASRAADEAGILASRTADEAGTLASRTAEEAGTLASRTAEKAGTLVSETAEEAGTLASEDEEAAASTATKTGFSPAESYEDIFQAIKTWRDENMIDDIMIYDTGLGTDGIAEDMITGVGLQKSAVAEASVTRGDGDTADYSTTNLMELGVDEGDIVKTDGEYLYILNENKLSILKISGSEAETMGEITLLDAGQDNFQEMYVDGERLILIADGFTTLMEENADSEYSMLTRPYTIAYTYSLTDPKNPKLLGTVKVDGNYRTSRRNGSFLYLMTDYYPVIGESAPDSVFIPLVNGENISASDILLPYKMESENSLVVVSVDLSSPEKIYSQRALVGISDLIYVSQKSIYVTQTDWNWEEERTNIMKFSYEDGELKGKAAGSVPGYLNDTFSLNEYDGNLRVVSTKWDGENQNGLYILDEQMNLTGKIENIAPGEQIYSARFMGNTGYFVTFRNTDPLFSVDLTDPANPRLLGELKITGFSEYLHFWGEDKLLGIGKEADAVNGSITGVKLSIFDISDPENVTEENRWVIDGGSLYCPGVNNYKAILADADKNLIGLAIGKEYLVFTYSKEEGFRKVLDADLTGRVENARGVYVKDYFYLSDSGTLSIVDMANGFGTIKKFAY